MAKKVRRGKYDADRVQRAAQVRGLFTPAKFAAHLSENPQTAHNWWKGKSPKISAVDLFYIADMLKVEPRWLLGLVDRMEQSEPLDPDESAVLALYRGLRDLPDQSWAEDWVSSGNKTLERLAPKSISVPFAGSKPK